MLESGSNIFRAITSSARVSGYSHNFYRYTARFSPEAARQIIAEFSARGDWILDPFMGGATSIIEAVTLGRSTQNLHGCSIGRIERGARNLSSSTINAIYF